MLGTSTGFMLPSFNFSCSAEDEAIGLCTRKTQTSPPPDHHGVYIALATVIVIVLIGVVLIIFLWKR